MYDMSSWGVGPAVCDIAHLISLWYSPVRKSVGAKIEIYLKKYGEALQRERLTIGEEREGRRGGVEVVLN